MNAYDECQEVERRGIELLKPFLDRESDGRWVFIKGHPQTERLQKECGDLFVTLPSGRMPGVDVKAEEDYTGNLVYEDWSNACFIHDPMRHLREGSTPGWTAGIRSEVLAFAWVNDAIVGFCRTIDFLRFANDPRTYKYLSSPITQRKRRQPNRTLFRLIPIRRFSEFFPFHGYRVGQSELFPENLLAIHQLVDDSSVAWHR